MTINASEADRLLNLASSSQDKTQRAEALEMAKIRMGLALAEQIGALVEELQASRTRETW